MSTSRTIQQLRPDVEPLDATWSAHTVERIFDTPPPRRSRRGLKALAATSAAIIGTSGAAYAAGLVPAFVSAEFDWISNAQIHNERLVGSFTVPAGEGVRTFKVWRAENDSGETCTLVLEAKGRFGPSFDGACSQTPAQAWFGWTGESSKISEPMPAATLYVYGEPTSPAVRRVRVHGPGFTHTTEVDPRTGGYAVAVPEVTTANHTERAGQVVASVDFLDASGQELDTLTVRDR